MEFKRHFTTIDAHVGGEPLRIITGGIPAIKGETILEKRAYFNENLDIIRRLLMYEPRGHHGMYGCVITPAVTPDADFGVLFMHNEGFSTMCGHGIIAVVTAAIETGLLEIKEERQRVAIDSPAGKIIAYAHCRGTEVKSVSFENVPSFVFASDVPVTLPDREFTVDIAFGGAFYAVADASVLGVQVDIHQLPELQRWGKLIKEQIESKLVVQHPMEKELNGIYGVILSDQPQKPNSHLRNVTVFADQQIDRSPCGTGTCARMATLFHKGQLQLGEKFVHESIIGSQFVGEIMQTAAVDPYPAIIPTVEGKAFITGMHQFVLDPEDPLSEGFLLR